MTIRDTEIETAYDLAHQGLSACVSPAGLMAGCHHFTDLWARDSLFATFGTNAVGEFATSKRTLQTFFNHQRTDGFVPYRILRSPTTWSKYRGRPIYFKTPRPNFRSHQSGGTVLDGGLMLIIAARNYAEKSSEWQFIKKQYPKLKKALMWYRIRFGEQLLKEWFLCEWADAVLKVGKVLYTNVLYYKALKDFSFISHTLGKSEDEKHFFKIKDVVLEKIQREFWNRQYFADWIDYKQQDYFSTHANLLAVWFGIASEEQTQSILKYAKEYCLAQFTLVNNYPRYPWWRIPIWNHILGMNDYHNGCLWLQPGILYALCLSKIGKKKEAKEFFKKLGNQTLKHQGIHEVYEKDGRPVKRFIYKAEYPFAWSCGLYVFAHHIIYFDNSG